MSMHEWQPREERHQAEAIEEAEAREAWDAPETAGKGVVAPQRVSAPVMARGSAGPRIMTEGYSETSAPPPVLALKRYGQLDLLDLHTLGAAVGVGQSGQLDQTWQQSQDEREIRP